MKAHRYLLERIYRICKKLGGLEVFLKWPLPAGKASAPQYLSFRLSGILHGHLRSVRIDVPIEGVPKLLVHKIGLEQEVPTGLSFRYQEICNNEKLTLLELYFLGPDQMKPWEFRAYTAEGTIDYLISEPICVRLSTQSMEKLIDAVQKSLS